MRAGHCNAIGCRALILDEEVFCARHLRMVQSDTRVLLGRKFRPLAKQQTATFRHFLELARREILFYQTEGHAMPHDRPFEWDDMEPTR
jgi:ERCC4-related helicase